jgi:DNA-binding beta-propeller fold protein YncE
LVWPQPPNPPRIRFVGAVARPADLGIEPSFWGRLGQVLWGEQEEWFVRPTDVWADGNRIYVADPGAQALWILNVEESRFKRVREAPGGQRLVSPVAVARGANQSLYVADSSLARVFVYDLSGQPQGMLVEARVKRPAGLAYDQGADRLYVADSAGHRVMVLTGAGSPLGAIGRRGTAPGEFNFPTHLAVGPEGTLYVTDALGYRIQTFARDGRFLHAFGRHGNHSGDFAAPKGVAVDSEGHVYVVDALFDAVQIFDRAGQFLLSFGQRGVSLGQFWLPGGLFIDAENRIYVADSYNQRIQLFAYLAGRGNE